MVARAIGNECGCLISHYPDPGCHSGRAEPLERLIIKTYSEYNHKVNELRKDLNSLNLRNLTKPK
jgi:hypothetical protein